MAAATAIDHRISAPYTSLRAAQAAAVVVESSQVLPKHAAVDCSKLNKHVVSDYKRPRFDNDNAHRRCYRCGAHGHVISQCWQSEREAIEAGAEPASLVADGDNAYRPPPPSSRR